jgi:hypothetical protein
MPQAHVAAIKACGGCGQWQAVLNLLDDMAKSDDGAIDGRVYSAAINACAYSTEWQQAVELLRKVPLSSAPVVLRCSWLLYSCNHSVWHSWPTRSSSAAVR